MSISPSVYLAGPDVFLPDAVEAGRRRVALCAEYGFIGLNPADNDLLPGTVPTATAIYQNNLDLLQRADLGIFNLSPFRAPGAGAGVAFDLGYLLRWRTIERGWLATGCYESDHSLANPVDRRRSHLPSMVATVITLSRNDPFAYGACAFTRSDFTHFIIE